ncbi:MAG: hypothetical protein AB7J28_14450 [Hyphomonadaceae bacterium]
MIAALIGVAVAFTAAAGVKRVAGLVIAHAGAALAITALGAPVLALAVLAAATGAVLLGAAIAARASEAYGSADPAEYAASDSADELEP